MIKQTAKFFIFMLLAQDILAQKPVDTRPQEKEVMLEKIFIEATREKILGNHEEAIARYLEVVQKDETNDVANYELASLYKHLEQYDKALIRAAKAVELDKKSVFYVDFYVTLLEKTGDNSKAAGLYTKLIELYPDNQRLYYECAYFWIKADNKEQAIKAYNNLEKRIGVNPELVIRKHKLYTSMGKDKKAIQELQALIDKFPKEPLYPLQMADYYKNTNKNAEARKYYEKVLQIAPNNPDANIAMAEIFRQEGDTLRYLGALSVIFDDPQQSAAAKVKVLESLVNGLLQQKQSKQKEAIMGLAQKMLTVHPDYAPGYLQYGHLMMYEARYEDAIQAYEMVVAVDKSKLEAWVQLMAAYTKARQTAKLLLKTKDFVELYPDQALGHYYRGLAYNKIGDYVNAQKSLKRAADMSMSDEGLSAYAKSALGEALAGQADYTKAEGAFAEAMRMQPNSLEISFDYCKSLLMRNADLAKAEELSNKLLKAEPANADYQALQAWLFYRKDKLKDAKQQFEKAINNGAGFDMNVIEHYGDVLFKLDDPDAALLQWKKALDMGSISSTLKRKIDTKKLYE